MRKASKALALLLALLMIVTAMPMSVFAEAAGAKESFGLVVDSNGKDDADVSSEAAGEIPSGTKLYDDNGVLIGSLPLDWDDFFTDDTQNGRDLSYKLWRNQGEFKTLEDAEEGNIDEGTWTQISMFSGDKVNVLVVYPTGGQGIMNKWLTTDIAGQGPAGKNLFNIEEVSLADFNANPALTVKNGQSAGKPYDVVLFGTTDTNGGSGDKGDLSASAKTAVENYLASGGGVLFGHDTLTTHGAALHPNFNSFASKLGIVLLDTSKLGSTAPGYLSEKTTNAKVVKQGTLTSYPWEITGNLSIPKTHALYQVTGEAITVDGKAITPATVWMELADGTGNDDHNKDGVYGTTVKSTYLPKGTSVTDPKSDFYLITNGNVAMIQTGHSSTDRGGASDDERKVFANTLFYLMDKDLRSYAVDIDFADEAPPVVNGLTTDSTDVAVVAEDIKSNMTVSGPAAKDGELCFGASFSWSGTDIGTPYEYKVDATLDNKVVSTTDVINAIAESGLKGYKVVLKDGSGNVIEDKGLVTDPSYTTPDDLKTETTYELHIIPVDRAGKEGEEVIVTFDQPYTEPNVEADITPTVSGTDTIPEDSRYEVVTSTDADGKEVTETTTYYYPGNYEDKDGKPFDKDGDGELYEEGERQEDDTIVLDITAKVDHSDREIIGTVVITDKDGNVIKEIKDIPGNPSYEYPLEDELEISIDEIYTEDMYGEDGEFTATITWNDKETGEEVAEDECKIIIKRPDYKVDVTYKVDDGNTKVSEVTETQIVKHGDKAKVPSNVPSHVYGSEYRYDFDQWNEGSKKYDFNTPVTSDKKIKASYDKETRNPGHEEGDRPTKPTKPAEPDEDVELVRLGGKTRIETAVEISKEGWDKSKVVIIATANLFPDAMAGVPLAKAVDAPILLTVNGESLEKVVKDEIARLSPEKVYILGQTAAVNENIEKELKALYNVERVGGKDRFGTSAKIAYELEEIYGEKADAVYFVRSDEFPDALSVSPVAAIEHNPILYIAPSGKMDVDVAEYAKTIGTDATIIGGEAAVNSDGEAAIKALFKNVDRIYGKDRYVTSVNICTAKNALFTGDATALATGKKFPDALTGGAFAAKKNIPVLLVNGNVTPELTNYLASRPIATLYVFGGEAAVSTRVAYDALGDCKYIGD